MTEKEKNEQLDKKLRPKYEHLSDDEYLKVRKRVHHFPQPVVYVETHFPGICNSFLCVFFPDWAADGLHW